MNHVWSGTMVEDSNLTVQIASLRKILGKDVIKTVPGVGYRFAQLGDAIRSAAAQPPPETPSSIPSLAVLPFTNLTGSDEREYLVDGIVNEVISALSRVSSFFVISSTSSFTYKNRSVEVSEVGRELGVRYVLEGSIQQSGDRLRISPQLVEAETGHLIWQDRFEGLVSEIFELQDLVAEKVAGALEPKLIWAEAAHAMAKPTESLEAYDLCMQAAPMIYRLNTMADLEDGLALIKRALELDPSYAYAKALFCSAHTGAFAARWWSFEKAQAGLPVARELLDAGSDDPVTLAYAGHHLAYIGKAHHEGLAALKHAFALNPNSATVALLLGWVHVYLAENDEAIVHLERVGKISPLHPNIGIATCGIGNAMMQKGDFEAAIRYHEQAMAESPEFASIHLGLMGSYWKLGRFQGSARIAEWFRAKVPDMSVATFIGTRPQNSKLYSDAVIAALTGNGFPD